jgi:acetoin utilization deacetylase AcuC-like enzyme
LSHSILFTQANDEREIISFSMAIPTVLVSSPACNQHDTGAGHPEHRGRLPGILDAVREDPALGEGVLERALARPAELEDVLRVHTREHVERMRAAAERAAANRVITWLDPDTAVSPASYEAALAAVGCAVEAADRVARGLARTAFALTRPPGHHATPGEAMGFCLFNNVAIAARYLKARHGVERALIVDWDVHHGNGTQEVFWEDPSVYYLSLHLWPHYPGTGAASERGAGAGEGTTRNVPLPYGTSARTYRACFDEALREALAAFSPEVVLVSAGFDCLAGDPLGGLLLEPEDCHAITVDLLQLTRPTAGGRAVAVLEGGYVPERMGRAAADVLRAFAGLPARLVTDGAVQ